MAVTREAAAASRVAQAPSEPYGKLSPGPGMPAQAVASHQCARIHSAMIEIAGEGGYSAVTVRELANLAGVSTRAFYQHFQDKDECILCTYQLVVQHAVAQVAAAQSGERDWLERLRRAFAAFAREVEDKSLAARLVLVETYAVGPAALEKMQRTDAIFETLLADSFSRAPHGPEMPPLLIKGVVAGLSRVTRARLLAGRESEMPDLADELLGWVLCLHDEAVPELELLDRRSPATRPTAELAPPRPSKEERCIRKDDRALLLKAVAKLAASVGYSELTVPRIRSAAGVSRRSFDANFEGVEDCFFAALEERTGEALQHAAAQASGDDWAGNVYRAISAICAHIARNQALAQLAFIEIFAPGPGGIRCREGIVTAIAELYRDSSPLVTQLSAEASVGAVWGVLHHHVTSGRARELPRIAATLSFLVLAPTIGAAAATKAIQREQKQC